MSGLKRLRRRVWAFFAKRPWLYRLSTRVAMRALALLGARKGSFSWLPFAGGWTKHRDFPSPQGPTFQATWKARAKLKVRQ